MTTVFSKVNGAAGRKAHLRMLMISSALSCGLGAVPAIATPIIATPATGPVEIGSSTARANATGGGDAAIVGVSSDGNVTIYAGTVSNDGEQGINAAAPFGSVFFDAITVSVAGGTTALVVDTAQSISIISGSIHSTGEEGAGIRAIAASRASLEDEDITGLNDGAIVIDSGEITASTDAIGAAGNGAITITSDAITMDEDEALGIYVHAGAGDVLITSGNITATGADSYGIAVTHQIEFDEALPEALTAGTGALSITSTAISLTGQGSVGIIAHHSGDIVINSGTIGMGSAGDAIIAETAIYYENNDGDDVLESDEGGSITISSTTITAQGGEGISARSGSGDIDIDSGTVTITDTAGDGDGTIGIDARSDSGDIRITSQSITVSSPYDDPDEDDLGALRAFSDTGTIVIDSGSINSAAPGRSGIYVDNGGDTTITSTQITTTGARAHGIHIDPETTGGAVVIDTGAITTTGVDAAAIHASNNDSVTIDITGALSSSNSQGVAIALFGNTANTVTQHSGGTVHGIVYADSGTNAVHLTGTSTTLSTGQVMATYDGFQSLSVDSGYWLAKDTISSFSTATVAAGATIELREVSQLDGFYSPVEVDQVTNNGTIIFNNASNDPGDTSSFDEVAITGTGDVRWVGSGTYRVDSDGVAHTGTTYIDNGRIILTGTLVSDVVTSGNGIFQLGNGGTSGEFQENLINNGTFIFARSDDYDFTGDLSGSGSLIKQGNGVLTLSGQYTYTGTTTVEGGSILMDAQLGSETGLEVNNGNFDLNGNDQNVASLTMGSGGTVDATGATLTVGQLTGAGGTITVGGGALVVDQTSAGPDVFAGIITGAGSFTKTGTGDLKLEGDSNYTGPTTVSGGRLSVNGSITSPVTVTSGATIGGSGSIGALTVQSGGFIAPGNSIDTLTVNGDVTLAAGSVYQVEVSASGASDKLVATGKANIAGAKVFVSPEAGNYALSTGYTILEADDGVVGEFAGTGIANDFAFLTPTLTYGADSVTLVLRNNNLAFDVIAVTSNQTAVASALTAAGPGTALYNAFATSLLSTAEARAAFDSLSGEVHAAIPTALIDESRQLRRALLTRGTLSRDEGIVVWGQVLGNWSHTDRVHDLHKLKSDRLGFLAGVEAGNESLRGGLALGLSDGDVRVGEADADIKTTSASLYGQWSSGRFAANFGASYSWHDIDTARETILAAKLTRVEADYNGHTAQIFGELSYNLIDGPLSVAPVAGVAWSSTHTKGFSEQGGATALDVEGRTRQLGFTTLGLKVAGNDGGSSSTRVVPTVSLLWQHAWGDRAGVAKSYLGGADAAMTVNGAQVARDSAQIDAGVDLLLGRNVRIGVAYSGNIASHSTDHGIKAGVSIGF